MFSLSFYGGHSPITPIFGLVFTIETVICYTVVGAWRSPVAHLHGGQVVAGSNPVAPTIILSNRYGFILPIPACLLRRSADSTADLVEDRLADRLPLLHIQIPYQEERQAQPRSARRARDGDLRGFSLVLQDDRRFSIPRFRESISASRSLRDHRSGASRCRPRAGKRRDPLRAAPGAVGGGGCLSGIEGLPHAHDSTGPPVLPRD